MTEVNIVLQFLIDVMCAALYSMSYLVCSIVFCDLDIPHMRYLSGTDNSYYYLNTTVVQLQSCVENTLLERSGMEDIKGIYVLVTV